MPHLQTAWLEVARKYACLTQKELSQLAGISQASLSKIEAGISLPSRDVVETLADAMGVPLGLLHSTVAVLAPEHALPRTRKATKKQVDRFWACQNILRLSVARLLESVEIDADFELPAMKPSRYDGGAAEIAARIRSGWEIPPGPIDDLVSLIEAAGVLVFRFDFGIDAIDGISHPSRGGLPPMIFLNARHPGCRQRFTAAHELGHLVMHRVVDDTAESEANEFASAFLMPDRDIAASLAPPVRLQKIALLKPLWGVSMAALLRKSRDIGYMSDSQYRRACIQMRKYGKTEPVPLVPEEPRMVRDLAKHHLDVLGYSPDELLEAALVPSRAWEHRSVFGLPDPPKVAKMKLVATIDPKSSPRRTRRGQLQLLNSPSSDDCADGS